MPAARVIQNTADMASRCSRARDEQAADEDDQIRATIHPSSGPHQKSSGSTLVLPRTRKAATRPTSTG